MKTLYLKILLSYCFVIKNNKHVDYWKFWSIYLISINFLLNIISLWLIFDTFIYSNFFSNMFSSVQDTNQRSYLFIILCFFPFVMFNSYFILPNNKVEKMFSKYPSFLKKKYSVSHTFISWITAIVVFLLVLNKI